MTQIDLDSLLNDPRSSFGKQPIDGAPAGRDMRDEPEFDALETEFRKMETAGPSAVDWRRFNAGSIEIIQKRSKDLVLGSRLVFGLQREEGYRGLAVGLSILQGMVCEHYDGLFPGLARERARAGTLDWMAEKVATTIESAAPVGDARAFALVAHDRLVELDEFVSGRMQKYPPALGPLIRALRPHARELRAELEAKAAAEQKAAEAANAVSAEPPAAEPNPTASAESAPIAAVADVVAPLPPTPVSEPPKPAPPVTPSTPAPVIADLPVNEGADKAFQSLFSAALRVAGALRPEAPTDPRVYLAARFAQWSPLSEAPPDKAGRTLLPPPQKAKLTELQALSAAGNQQGLLLSAEGAFVSSPFWLDAQFMVVRAMLALGPGYDAARLAISGQLSALLKRVPGVLALSFSDGMAFADPETRSWISSDVTGGSGGAAEGSELDEAKAAAFRLGQQGQVLAGLKILSEYSDRCHGGRDRFVAKLEIGEYCLRFELIQPLFALLQSLEQTAEAQDLKTWDPRMSVALSGLSWRSYTHKNTSRFVDEREVILRKQKVAETLGELDIIQAVRLTMPQTI